MSRDPVRDLPSLDVALAKLRHAYEQAAHNQIGNQREFADGLIAPAIRRLEEFKDKIDRIVQLAESEVQSEK